MDLEPLIKDLTGIDQMLIVLGDRGAVGEMHLDAAKTPEFSDSYATFWGEAWHVHMNMERVTAVQFVEAEDHGFVPFLYYVRFSDAEEQTVMRLYFPNPYLDDDEKRTDFQPERLAGIRNDAGPLRGQRWNHIRATAPSERIASAITPPSMAVPKGAAGVFSKEQIEGLFDELKRDYGMEPDWEIIVRQAHLGVAYSDANAELKDIDPRVVAVIEKHRAG